MGSVSGLDTHSESLAKEGSGTGRGFRHHHDDDHHSHHRHHHRDEDAERYPTAFRDSGQPVEGSRPKVCVAFGLCPLFFARVLLMRSSIFMSAVVSPALAGQPTRSRQSLWGQTLEEMSLCVCGGVCFRSHRIRTKWERESVRARAYFVLLPIVDGRK